MEAKEYSQRVINAVRPQFGIPEFRKLCMGVKIGPPTLHHEYALAIVYDLMAARFLDEEIENVFGNHILKYAGYSQKKKNSEFLRKKQLVDNWMKLH
jgi:hypothetical protein